MSYPDDAAKVRDLIRDTMLACPGFSGGDTGGGCGGADVWLTYGDAEFVIRVRPTRPQAVPAGEPQLGVVMKAH